MSEARLALELTHHASFPYVFSDNGRIFMVPETAALGEVSLYEALDFPNNWVKRRTLLKRGWFGDSILFKYNGHYWIFTVLDSVEDLHIYYAESLFSEFKPHPVNREKRKGRNAGKTFMLNGALIRPVMCCQPAYGYSLIFKEIVGLTTTTFIEKEIYRIAPVWHPRLRGTHTFTINEDIIVYDGHVAITKDEEYQYSSSE